MSGHERDASVAKTMDFMPANTEDMSKDILLQKLLKSIYFEKTVSVSNAANYAGPCTMAWPAWFVAKHGDKFQTSILLWSGSSNEPWRVELSLLRGKCSRPEVRLSTGSWKPFAVAHDLVVGDSLIFCLRAMSEFDVYIFREAESSIKSSAIQAPRKWSHDFELPKAKVRKYYVGRRRRKLVAERRAGRVVSETVEGAVRTWSRVKDTPVRDWVEKISFEIALSRTAASRRCRLTLPRAFVQQHSDKIQKYVVLQSVADRKMWTVKVYIYYNALVYAQVVFAGYGWTAFVASNGLVVGDRLTFSLVAMSKFEVLILRSVGNGKAVPSGQGPVRRSKGSAFSQTRQPTKCLIPVPQHRDLTGKCSVAMERELSSELFAEKEDAEGSVTHSASDSSKPFRRGRSFL